MTSVSIPHTVEDEVNNASPDNKVSGDSVVNFSGRWRLDLNASDSLTGLMRYHGLKDESLLEYAESLIPTLTITHTKGKISTDIVTEQKPNTSGQLPILPQDQKQDSNNNNNDNNTVEDNNIVHEEYIIDGHYHGVKLKQGFVQSRCYVAPHGKSVIVDTKCANPYDLERTERYLTDKGNTMVLEIRILSCDPAKSITNNPTPNSSDSNAPLKTGVASPFASHVQKPVIATNNVVVTELLFCKRVFKKL